MVARQRAVAADYITHLRLPFQFLLSPIFLWGVLLAGGSLNLHVLVTYIAFHIFLYAGGTALNSHYDRDEGPIGGLEQPPPVPRYLLLFSLVWQIIGFLLTFTVNRSVAAIYFVMFCLSVAYSHTQIRFKGNPLLAIVTIMLGQGILPFFAGWATARGDLDAAFNLESLIAALAATLIIGGFYPLTQLYQLEADARRGDMTVARFLGIDGSFRFAMTLIILGGAGALWIAFTRFSWVEALGLALFLSALLYAVSHWRARFDQQSVIQNFRAVMRLYAGVTLPFLAWILFRLGWQSLS